MQITAWKALCTRFSHSLVKYQEYHSFAAFTRLISDTTPTRVKIPYARAFHKVISIFCMTNIFVRVTSNQLSLAMFEAP